MANDRFKTLQRAYVERVLAKTGLTPTELMKRIGKAPSTLNRFLNSKEHAYLLSLPTLHAIASFSRMTVPSELLGADRHSRGGETYPIGLGEQAEIMRIVVERVDELISADGIKLAPAKRNEIVGLIYEDILRLAEHNSQLVFDAEVRSDRIRRLISLAR